MRIAVFDTHRFEREIFEREAPEFGFEMTYFEQRLTLETAPLARRFDVVCSFANDRVDRATIDVLHEAGVRLLALRSAGFNHVDLAAARERRLPVVRVPEYSPYAVAEHAVGLLLCLNRKLHRAYARVRECNFSLEGLVGFDVHGKVVGVVGTGRIGVAFARIMLGFGCRVLAFDLKPDEALRRAGVAYVPLDALCAESDVISLHVPLSDQTRHLIDRRRFALMKPSVIVINTGRGGLIETRALVDALKRRTLGGAALDVYEEEEGVFFNDRSSTGVDDDLLARLLTFPNVLVTSHQAFLTNEALTAIVRTTLENVRAFTEGRLVNAVGLDHRISPANSPSSASTKR